MVLTEEETEELSGLCLKYHIIFLSGKPFDSLVLCLSRSDNRTDSETLMRIRDKIIGGEDEK